VGHGLCRLPGCPSAIDRPRDPGRFQSACIWYAARHGLPPGFGSGMSVALPALVAKALADTGYDLLTSADGGWVAAAVSGNAGRILVKATDDGALLAVAEPSMAQRIGLAPTTEAAPGGMADVGLAHGA